MQTTIQSQTAFKRSLTNWRTGQTKQREALQDCILFGLKQYADHGNTTPLSEVMCALHAAKTVKADYVKEYIKAHANVRLTANKDNKELPWLFKKNGKDVVVTEPQVAWYDHSSNKTKPTADVDGLAKLRSALAMALKAEKEGKLKAGQSSLLHKAVEALRPILDPKAEKEMQGDKPQAMPA